MSDPLYNGMKVKHVSRTKINKSNDVTTTNHERQVRISSPLVIINQFYASA